MKQTPKNAQPLRKRPSYKIKLFKKRNINNFISLLFFIAMEICQQGFSFHLPNDILDKTFQEIIM